MADGYAQETKAYMVFLLDGKYYAVAAAMLQECVRLPELTPVDDEPAYIAGVINVRGRVAPVMNLNLRMGRRTRPYWLSDCVLLLQIGDGLLGIIVDELVKLAHFAPADCDSLAHFESLETEGRHRLGHCVSAVARDGDELVMLLDERVLYRAAWPETIAVPQSTAPEADGVDLPPPGRFQALVGEDAYPVFRARRLRLMARLASDEDEQRLPLALVRLGGELVAMEVELVRGFAQVRSITPVPCCPEAIVGNINLRGEILTVVDLRELLRLSQQGNQETGGRQILVVEIDDLTAGILVDEVLDIILLDARDITRAPVAGGALNEEYVKGTALLQGQVISIINLKNVFAADALGAGSGT